ncbi:MAG: AMP-binding protein, partial [Proteobacteria bacterium]|nr:AMP-binding protein [Pseudomonadota bacterium]
AGERLAKIIYTSGTTGEPKGVMLRHRNLVANVRSIVEYLGLTERDRVMAVLPFFYVYGNSVLLTHAAVGGSLVVNQSLMYPNVILEQMTAEGVTGFSGVPSTFAILLNRSSIREHRFPALRYVTQAGGAMSPKLACEVREVLPQTDVFIMYGQTEASARLSYLPPADLLRKAGSIGRAIPGVRLQVLRPDGSPAGVGEVGEIVAQGDNVMAGYWGKPEETAQVLRAEGLWTGDLAKTDEEGYLYIVSRKSDMIKSGAHRIAPKEIEELIQEHPAVHEVAVFGVDDEILGEAIHACAVLKGGVRCTEKELTRFCRENLPAFKVPHKVEFRDDLPKTASGKIRKEELRRDSSTFKVQGSKLEGQGPRP